MERFGNTTRLEDTGMSVRLFQFLRNIVKVESIEELGEITNSQFISFDEYNSEFMDELQEYLDAAGVAFKNED